MIKRLSVIHADGSDPVQNLALESVLMELVHPEEMILYLWQNDNTIVIGKNQNIRKECQLERIRENGVHLVRRSSGGGAVYHDLGNLNFSFITKDENYDVKRQTEILCDALASFGIEAAVSGRNDVTVQGRKVSGNAYYHSHGVSLQHGTLLIDTDLTAMSRYLRPDPEKLKARGVDSVRSRVMNLKEVCPQIDPENARKAMIHAAEKEYGCMPQPFERMDPSRLEMYIRRYGSEEWIFGPDIPFEEVLEKRFAWGGIRFEFHVENDRITELSVWSDSMDPETIDAMKEILRGIPYRMSEIYSRFCTLPESTVRDDILVWLKQLEEQNAV